MFVVTPGIRSSFASRKICQTRFIISTSPLKSFIKRDEFYICQFSEISLRCTIKNIPLFSQLLLPDLSSEAFAINRVGAKGAVTNIEVRNRNLSLPIRL